MTSFLLCSSHHESQQNHHPAHGSPGSQLLKSYFQKCFLSLPPDGEKQSTQTQNKKVRRRALPCPSQQGARGILSDSVQTPQPVYGGKERCPLESPRRTLEGRQRGPSGGVQCTALPTLGTQAYSPVKCRPHSQVVLINNRTFKALFSFSLHPS